MNPENRKYTRFAVQGKIYAALGTHFSRVGKLKDISVDGLAFEYLENTESSESNSSMVSIFHSENSFFLSHLACAVIYDLSICEIAHRAFFKKKYLVKRCGIQFTAINSNQRKQIEFFLNNYTCGLVPLSKEVIISP